MLGYFTEESVSKAAVMPKPQLAPVPARSLSDFVDSSNRTKASPPPPIPNSITPIPIPIPSTPLSLHHPPLLLKPLPPPPLPLPPSKPRTLLQRPNLPPPLRNPHLLLLPTPQLQRRQRDMLDMPRVLVPHDLGLALPQHLQQQRGHVGLVPELADRREERFEVEDYGAGEGEAAEGLPVYAQVDAREGEG